MNAAPDYREQIAALERRVKEAERVGAVRALREAADEVEALESFAHGKNPESRAHLLGYGTARRLIVRRLRDRADRIEAESPHGLRCIQTPCDACGAGGGS